MKIGILSDIHSNCFALVKVLEDAHHKNIRQFIILGDIFGYYPWAVETYQLLKDIGIIYLIKGNHDLLVTRKKPPEPKPVYWQAAKYNELDLTKRAPEALSWLEDLPFALNFFLDGLCVNICHGTPNDHENGRFYPNDVKGNVWFPPKNELLMLGHTHYPFYKASNSHGLILNPGSVGQPRDGNPMPSWVIFDTETLNIDFQRTHYDNHRAIKNLKDMDWDKLSIAALNKNYLGPLIY